MEGPGQAGNPCFTVPSKGNGLLLEKNPLWACVFVVSVPVCVCVCDGLGSYSEVVFCTLKNSVHLKILHKF